MMLLVRQYCADVSPDSCQSCMPGFNPSVICPCRAQHYIQRTSHVHLTVIYNIRMMCRPLTHFAGVYGRVTELCKVSQRKYNLAIAVLMGKNIDSVVVDTERTAKDCIQYLKEQGVPPMTFIPVQTVKVSGCTA